MGETEISVVVCGAAGRMGRAICGHLTDLTGIRLAGAYDRNAGTIEGTSFEISAKLGALLDEVKPDVMVEVTHPGSATDHTLTALKRGISVVIGTSGVTTQNQREIADSCSAYQASALLVPNFALGAVLMMKFAEMAAEWMPDMEIIEMHHDAKLDAPSGTARATAERMSNARKSVSRKPVPQGMPEARGALVKDISIHSVRMKGLVAHQEVIFGNLGEILSIRHDSLDRQSFMAGVELAVRRVRETPGLTVGLDSLLFDPARRFSQTGQA